MTVKSIFISFYISVIYAALAHAGWMLNSEPANLAWWAVVIALAPGALFFIRIFLAPVARTSAIMWPFFIFHAAGTVLLISTGSHDALPWLYVMLIGWGGSAAYQLWYSRFGRSNSQMLALGKQLPDVVFEDTNGNAVKARELTGSLLLIFYRGNWCPLCMAQIREVADQYQELAARGVKTLLISSQPHENTAALAEKFKVSFHFLVDPDNRVARQLNIFAKNGTPMGLQALGYDSDTAMPTVVLTDANKKIIFCDETDNYRVRPEPEIFLRILDGLPV